MEIGSILTNRYNAAAAGIVKNPLTVSKASANKEEVQVQISEQARDLNNISTKQAYSLDPKEIEYYKNNPKQAAIDAKRFAYGIDFILVPAPTSRKYADHKYLDGTPVTDTSYSTKFRAEADLFRQQRIDLYEKEKAKGTSSIEILEKIYELYANQPESYKLKIGYI
ncbi:hypothetical protein [Endozoicomonas sp. 4G]|uniref:hypothetical protein n=1 Tax=Endozoicomonas sp. 4G TaxID=2872754 RepID=UPI0020785E9F|nr:hypothetical protein [Endozoicomonas sp. 4G]